MEQTGLVLEGGGMRGVYTAGVLEFFMDKNIYFPYVIGVSAGACNAASYLARQKERNRRVNIGYIGHPQYLSYKNLFRKGQLFDMDFIFNEIPTKHVPFDFEAYRTGIERFVIGTTDVMTGKPAYFEKDGTEEEIMLMLRASSSLPFIAPIVELRGQKLLDGGIADPIPVRKAQADGNKKIVLVLTRNDGYQKQKSKFGWIAKRSYKRYPELVRAMLERYQVYNETLAYIQEEEKKGNIFIIRPTEPLQVDRMEKDAKKLAALYDQGYKDADRLYEDLLAFLEK
ncbi:patatin family protein [Ectobacillus sp. JY-23]|uniref:patatin-like phospholipase family protein n=1 Tax=Ectobacillus sp. JY-23 TaxID=2933872 RepID=UPI001FF5C61F|nr:patatin family protein [Ectobacillus sp. JY-23]UOY91980.1 patatin family protein [Ectobacillus sp. JY-23]